MKQNIIFCQQKEIYQKKFESNNTYFFICNSQYDYNFTA